MREDTCVFKHTGKASEENCVKEQFECVLNGGYSTTFSVRSIRRKIGCTPTEEQFRVRYCRNVETHFRAREGERERTIARNYPARTRNDRNPNAPAYEDLHQQWNQHCEERA